ncbi:MAG: alternative ribosome rescue aminoacyl-tRNA hydrolase ArfB [Hyphomicrobiaceae bacterium]
MAVRITDTLSIEDDEIVETFIRAGGPGGQNVNKVSTAVQLRFDVRNSPSLFEAVKRRLEKLAGSKLTRDGVIVITANRKRTQDANRRDARERLVELIAAAAVPPKRRVPTKPRPAAKKRRMDEKSKRGAVKRTRGKVRDED